MGRQIKDATSTKTEADLGASDLFPGQEAAGGSGSSFSISGSSLAAWFAANMPAASIAYAKIADMATDKLLGRASAGSGVIEEIDLTPAGRALLDDADAAAQRTTLGAEAAGAAATAVSNHEAASDPHTGYQRESQKGAASGYASLDSSTLVPKAELGAGTPDSSTYLRGDGTWATPAGTVDYETGSFTINSGWSDFDTQPSLSFSFARVGQMVTVTLTSGVSISTSNGTAFQSSASALPVAITPTANRRVSINNLWDSGNGARAGTVTIQSTGGLSFSLLEVLGTQIGNSGSFTATGNKGLGAASTFSYML